MRDEGAANPGGDDTVIDHPVDPGTPARLKELEQRVWRLTRTVADQRQALATLVDERDAARTEADRARRQVDALTSRPHPPEPLADPSHNAPAHDPPAHSAHPHDPPIHNPPRHDTPARSAPPRNIPPQNAPPQGAPGQGAPGQGAPGQGAAGGPVPGDIAPADIAPGRVPAAYVEDPPAGLHSLNGLNLTRPGDTPT